MPLHLHPSAAHSFLPSCGSSKEGGRERPLTGGAGTEPMGGLQVLDASRVLAWDVDGGGLRCRRVKPGLAGSLSI